MMAEDVQKRVETLSLRLAHNLVAALFRPFRWE